MNNININNMTIEQLKAIAYDLVKQRLITERNLIQVENIIEKKEQEELENQKTKSKEVKKEK